MSYELSVSEPVIPCLEDGRLNVPMFRIEAKAGDVVIGRMLWHKSNGDIEKLWVATSFRRQGIATAMWRLSQTFEMPAKHSEWRTNDGDAWARAIGGELPPRLQA